MFIISCSGGGSSNIYDRLPEPKNCECHICYFRIIATPTAFYPWLNPDMIEAIYEVEFEDNQNQTVSNEFNVSISEEFQIPCCQRFRIKINYLIYNAQTKRYEMWISDAYISPDDCYHFYKPSPVKVGDLPM